VIAVFKQKNPANIILLLVFGILIKLPMFLHPHAVTAKPGDGLLFRKLLEFISPDGNTVKLIYPLLAFALLFFQAIQLTRFMNSQRMMNKSTYLPGMAYLLITSLFPEWNYLTGPLIVNTILLFVLNALFKTYNQPSARGAIFNIGLAMGIASFIFFPSITFIIWILLALMLMRPFRLNEWVLCVVGITTPFYFYAIYLFINGEWSWSQLWPYFSISLPSIAQSAWLAGSAFLLAIPFLTGGYYVQDNLRRMLIQVRKGWSLLLLYLLGAIFIPFVNSTNTFETWVMAAIPFAAFHAFAYLYANLKIIPLLIFWLSVAFIIGYQYYGPGW
jgi:hypothetical protein